MNDLPSGPIQVKAVVHEWKDGPYGTWANAAIVTDAPTKAATFSVKILGTQPEAGKPFHCEIAFRKNRWSIVAVLLDHLPSTLQGVKACVGDPLTKGSRGYSLIPLAPDSDLDGVALVLPQAILEKAGIALIRAGTEVHVDAERNGSRFEATTLHAPHAGQAFPADRPAGQDQTPVVAFAINAWSESSKKPVLFATHEVGAPVSARIWVPHSALRSLGIQAVHRATLPETETDEQSREQIDAWSAALRGSREQRDAVSIDRILVWVQSSRNGTQWDFLRLLGPGERRVPTRDGEVVDWVGAIVDEISIHVASRSPTPPDREPGSQFDADSPPGADHASEAVEPRMKVTVTFSDERLGHGKSRAFLTESITKGAGLAPGVPVIVRLVSKDRYWNVSHLHRATPHLSPTDNDPALAQ
ncbi:hypothetical protein [Burkholderia perseverans]|uniref:hypothetical protein n=1 Tax=Burkholderia perseverans TaxID=2615214 RepID=UPI001FEDC252|nr:hypothetical protein [Burkholderia perseverans]